MSKLQDIAELLVASWVLSQEGEEVEPLPTSHSLLDRALDEALKKGAFPKSWQQRLHFVDSRIGLQCVELQAVIEVAQQAEFTSEPNPSYKATHIKVGPRTARALLRRHSIPIDTAKRWGAVLHGAVGTAKATLEQYPDAP
ncbi:MAG TPA: hypothetical protein VF989_10110 [Polyangiaceae bacterium]